MFFETALHEKLAFGFAYCAYGFGIVLHDFFFDFLEVIVLLCVLLLTTLSIDFTGKSMKTLDGGRGMLDYLDVYFIVLDREGVV